MGAHRLLGLIRDVVDFMRFETDHHNIALRPSPVTLLHHTARKVRTADEVGHGGSVMVENHPYRHAWGLGRHAASANYFWYLRDPWGSWTEYFTGIGQITDAWIGREWDVPPAVWCALKPEDFAANLEPADTARVP